MNRSLAPAVALLLAAAPIAAQEEPSVIDLYREIRERFELLNLDLRERENELTRRLQLLERLTRGARELAESAPATGRDAARHGIEEAQAIAEKEPPLDREVFRALDRAEAELGRSVLGESPAATAARFLGEVLPIEQGLATDLQGYLIEVQMIRRLADEVDGDATKHLADGVFALQRLYAVHAAAIAARAAAGP